MGVALQRSTAAPTLHTISIAVGLPGIGPGDVQMDSSNSGPPDRSSTGVLFGQSATLQKAHHVPYPPCRTLAPPPAGTALPQRPPQRSAQWLHPAPLIHPPFQELLDDLGQPRPRAWPGLATPPELGRQVAPAGAGHVPAGQDAREPGGGRADRAVQPAAHRAGEDRVAQDALRARPLPATLLP